MNTPATYVHSHSGSSPLSGWKPFMSFYEVIQMCSMKLTEDPYDWGALRSRARAFVHLHRYEAGVKDWSSLLHHFLGPESESNPELQSSLCEAFFYRGLCLEKLNLVEDAVLDLTEALVIDPKMKRAAYERAICHNRLEKFEEAIIDYEQALAADCYSRATLPTFSNTVVPVARETTRPPSLDVRVTSESWAEPAAAAPQSESQRTSSPSLEQLELSPPRETIPQLTEFWEEASTGSPLPIRQEHRWASEAPEQKRPSVSSEYAASRVLENQVEVQDRTTREGSQKKCDVAGPRLLLKEDTETETKVAHVPHWDSPMRHSISPRSMSLPNSVEEDTTYHSAMLLYKLGIEHRKRGEMVQAIQMFTKVVELDPSHCRALFNRGYCNDKEEHFGDAVADYQRAIELDPQNPFTYYNLGIVFDKLEDYAAAMRCFSQAISIEPRNPDFFHNRGLTERKIGNYGAAIENYTRAIHLQPDHFKALYNRAFCFDLLEQFARAVQDYTSAIAVQGDNQNAYHNRGAAHEKLGMIEEAVADFDEAIRLNPMAAFSYNARGLCYHQQRKFSLALEDFNKAVRLQPDNPTFLHNRGFCYRTMGKLYEALEDYNAALKRSSDNLLTYNNRAFIFRKLRRFPEAVADYTAVLQHGVSAKTLNNRAYCNACQGKLSEALQDYSQTLTMEPHNTNARYNRAVYYEKSEDYVRAMEDYTRVIEDPASPPADVSSAYLRRGASQLRLGNADAAREDLERAISLDVPREEHPGFNVLLSIP